MGPADAIYAKSIDLIISVIGYEAAANALFKEAHDRLDATQRQAFSNDGAFADEVAGIVRDFPRWDIRFPHRDDVGASATISSTSFVVGDPDADREAAEIGRRANEAFKKYNKTILPGVGLSIKVTKGLVTVDE